MGLCLWLSGAGTGLAQSWQAEHLVTADYAEPTDRYPHGVLGDTIEYGALTLHYSAGPAITIRLPQTRVFEDIAPRIVDVDGDQKPEALVIESHANEGARLAIYNGDGLMAATPYIGTRFRWLAPIGTGDLDGDGHVEIAYIDRPHLAKRLRIWRFKDGALQQIADKDGLTNHRIGEDFISGGLRTCAGQPELLTANANWSRIMASTFDGHSITSRDLGPFDKTRLNAALNCE
ncbi:VCBS repeat-containing protein [Aliishimia ponticola]|uniref:VCBS repeat-containing protein n=2 Tax=Aliishimia ponticola TaxID=2499833 RepID=A0A4V3XKM1_9RHOB|nr:VCBS repeat-containing protein [Aliishimia ponticola]